MTDFHKYNQQEKRLRKEIKKGEFTPEELQKKQLELSNTTSLRNAAQMQEFKNLLKKDEYNNE
jgi:hypothetical protein